MKYATFFLSLMVLGNSFASRPSAPKTSRPPAIKTTAANSSTIAAPLSPTSKYKLMQKHEEQAKAHKSQADALRASLSAKPVVVRDNPDDPYGDKIPLLAHEQEQALKALKICKKVDPKTCVAVGLMALTEYYPERNISPYYDPKVHEDCGCSECDKWSQVHTPNGHYTGGSRDYSFPCPFFRR